MGVEHIFIYSHIYGSTEKYTKLYIIQASTLRFQCLSKYFVARNCSNIFFTFSFISYGATQLMKESGRNTNQCLCGASILILWCPLKTYTNGLCLLGFLVIWHAIVRNDTLLKKPSVSCGDGSRVAAAQQGAWLVSASPAALIWWYWVVGM